MLMPQAGPRGESASSASQATSLSLLARVRSGDEESWRRLVELYAPLVYHWCRRCGLGSEDAYDVGQEVFAAAARNLGSFRKDTPSQSFRGWLRVVTRSKIQDHFRRRRREPDAAGGTTAHWQLANLPDPLTNETSAADQTSEIAHLLRRAAEMVRVEFREKTWQAFWMLTIEELDVARVSLELGMTPGAVRQAKYAVLRRLRTELGEVLG
jgi:RNA polymerase sigma-70 factor (ECF subfamily)